MLMTSLSSRSIVVLLLSFMLAPLAAAQTTLDSAFQSVLRQQNPSPPSDSVVERSFRTPGGERVLRFEIVLDTPIHDAWSLFTTEEGIRTWQVPTVKLDFRIGGTMRTHYGAHAVIGDPGTITQNIVNYLPGEMISFKINLTEAFPEKTRREDAHLQHILQFTRLGERKTRVTSSMVGWGNGKEWDGVYEMFERGNKWTFQQLLRRMKEGPKAWE